MGELLVLGCLGWAGYSLYREGKHLGSRKGYAVGVRKARRGRR